MKKILHIAAALSLTSPMLLNETLTKLQDDAASWLSYGKNYSDWRYSSLAQIRTANVAQLVPARIFHTGVAGNNETTPLVSGEMMYLTGPSNTAWAVDLLTGRKVWSYSKDVPTGLGLCCGPVNRGFAMLGDRLFKMNIQATLVALEAKSGKILWETTIDD